MSGFTRHDSQLLQWICGAAALSVVLSTGVALADWPTRNWMTQCAATSPDVDLTTETDRRGRTFDCIFDFPGPAGEPERIVVPDLTRRAIEAVLRDISGWYDTQGFGSPLLRYADRGVLLTDPVRAEEAGLVAPVRLAPLDAGPLSQTYLALIDPNPLLEGTHGEEAESVLGFYSPSAETLVFNLVALRGEDGELLTSIPDVDVETIAHEIFHAILAGTGPYARPDFIEEGLSDAFGRLYMTHRLPTLAGHPFQTYYGAARFATTPLMTTDEDSAYDSSVFFLHLHDRVLGGSAAFVRLLNDYDLSQDEQGSAVIEEWLRAETGRGLMEHWRDFAQRVSAEAEGVGRMDDLTRCAQGELSPATEGNDTTYDVLIAETDARLYTLKCLRLTLPRGNVPRELFIEAVDGTPYPETVEIYGNGTDMRDLRLDVPIGQTDLTLLIVPYDPGLSIDPDETVLPQLRVVLEAPAAGCRGFFPPEELSRSDRERMQALAGTWRGTFGTLNESSTDPACYVTPGSMTNATPNDIELRYENGTLVSEVMNQRFYLVPDASFLSDIEGYEGHCGTRPSVNGARILTGDWVAQGGGETMVFMLENLRDPVGDPVCSSVAVVSNTRLATYWPILPIPYRPAGESFIYFETDAFER